MRATCACLILWAALAGLTQAAAPFPPRGTEERPVVSDVIIRDNRHLSTEYIKNLMKTRVGREFVPEVLQEDVRRLFSTRRFGNVWADRQDDGPGRVKVTVWVKDYPSVLTKVSYQGNVHLSNDELAELTGVRVGMPCNPIANKVACRKVVQRYAEDGRPYASCDLLKGGEAGDTEVVFNVTEGPKVRIKDIAFVGNTFVSGAVLEKRIQSSGKFLGLPIGGTYNQAMLDQDTAELTRYYRSLGFHDVKVYSERVPTPDGREVLVIIHIHEGVRGRPPGPEDDPNGVYAEILEAVRNSGGSLTVQR